MSIFGCERVDEQLRCGVMPQFHTWRWLEEIYESSLRRHLHLNERRFKRERSQCSVPQNGVMVKPVLPHFINENVHEIHFRIMRDLPRLRFSGGGHLQVLEFCALSLFLQFPFGKMSDPTPASFKT